MSTYINKNGQQLGPFSDEQIIEGLKNGLYSPEDLCWREGWSNWKPLREVYNVAVNAKNKPSQSISHSDIKEPVSKFESGVFSYSRKVIKWIAYGIVVGIVLCVLALFIPAPSTKVSYDEANSVTNKTKSSGVVGSVMSKVVQSQMPNPPEELKYPKVLKDFFDKASVNSSKIPDFDGFKSYMEDKCKLNNKQEALDELGSIVEKAQKNSVGNEDIMKIINNYFQVKAEKENEREMTSSILNRVKMGCLIAIGSLLVLLFIVSLIMVLLAIERNTRILVAIERNTAQK